MAFFSRAKNKRYLSVLMGTMALTIPHGAVWAAESKKESKPFTYDARNRRDPFLPLVVNGRPVGWTPKSSSMDTSKPALYGILWDPGGASIALIDDGEYRIGETVNGYQVKEIREDAVVLENGGGPVVLTIAFDTPPEKLSPDATTGGKRR